MYGIIILMFFVLIFTVLIYAVIWANSETLHTEEKRTLKITLLNGVEKTYENITHVNIGSSYIRFKDNLGFFHKINLYYTLTYVLKDELKEE